MMNPTLHLKAAYFNFPSWSDKRPDTGMQSPLKNDISSSAVNAVSFPGRSMSKIFYLNH